MNELKPVRRTLESTPFISINHVKDLNKGIYTLKWGNNEAITIDNYLDHVILRYKVADKVVKIHVGISKTKVGYGMRDWFNCPTCNKRAAKLYNVRGKFACRICHDLIYEASKLSGSELNIIAMKIRRLQDKLEMNTRDIHETPTYKPKYMHQNTFDRLRMDLGICQLHFMEEWLKIAR